MDLFVVVHDELELDEGRAVGVFAEQGRAEVEARGVVDVWRTPDLDAAALRDLGEESEITAGMRDLGVVWREVYSVDGGQVTVYRLPVQ